MHPWIRRILPQLPLLAFVVFGLTPAASMAKGNARWLSQAKPTQAERRAVDWVRNRPSKHRKVTWGSWPERIKVRTPEGVHGSGVFAKGSGMVSIKTWKNETTAQGKELTRELFFSPQGKHIQTNLVSEKGGVETTRVFVGGKWDHTTTRYPGGRAVHFTPRTGSKPRPGIY